MLATIAAALDEGDIHPLRRWLVDAGVDVEAVRALPQWNSAVRPDALPTALRSVATQRYGIALLLVYLLHECEQSWEVSYHYRPIWAALRDGANWQRHVTPIDESEQTLASAAAALLAIVDAEIQVENAMTSGRLGGFGDVASTLVAQAGDAVAAATAAAQVSPELGRYIKDRALAAREYYQGVSAAGHDLRRFLAEPGASLHGAIERLSQVERSDAGIEINRLSELRAHRFSLLALQSDVDRPWLHVEFGKILYVYPFALHGSPEDVVRTAAELGDGWDLAGVRPAAVHASFNADDVWDGTDLFGRAYDGTKIELPRVTMVDLAGTRLAALTAEVRLSNIGNHYVRLEAELRDANPQDVYSAMFRAAPEHGTALVTVEDCDETWDRLSDFAQDIAAGVATALHRQLSGQHGAGQHGAARDDSLARRGPYHVLLVVDAASVSTGPTGPRREILSRDDVVSAVGGQVLVNPVTHCVSALAEWSRYPLTEPFNILSSVTHRDDMVVRTANTTVFVALGSPSFHTATRLTVAEFVASLDGLFAGWSADLTTYFHEVNRMLQESSRLDGSAPAAQIRKSAVDLRAMEQTLNEFITKVRSTVALIESPGLVASPVVSVMKAGLLQAAGFRNRAAELDQQVEQVLGNRLVDRIDETVRGLEEGRERRQRARMDTALAVVAAVGISGLGQIIQAGYDVRSVGAVWITLTVLGLAALFGLTIRWANRGARLHSHPAQPTDAAPVRAAVPKSRPEPDVGPRAIDSPRAADATRRADRP